MADGADNQAWEELVPFHDPPKNTFAPLNLPRVGCNVIGSLTFGSEKGSILVVCDGSGGHGC